VAIHLQEKAMLPRTLFPALLFPALAACVASVDEHGLSFGGSRPKGSGVSATTSRDVAPFEAVTLSCAGDVRVQVGPARSVTVRCDDNLERYVHTRVEQGRLRIEVDGNPRFRSSLEVQVTTPALSGASIEGSGRLAVTGIDRGDFSAAISGSGDLRASGQAERVEAAISGSGSLELQDLRASAASVHVSGSGTIRVAAAERLDASISGSGEVIYLGDPERNVHVSGSGRVRRE
jgi:hypothetical protein